MILLLNLSGNALSQNTKTDSTTVSNRAFDLMMKDLQKCDSTKVALDSKNDLIIDLIERNLESFADFKAERKEKEQHRKDKNEALDELMKSDKKIFGLGALVGFTLDSDFNPQPVFGIGVTIDVWRF